MASPFSRTLRSIERDGHRLSLLLLVACAALVAGWIAWACLARVTVYERSVAARLVLERAVRPIEAPADGDVAALRFALGQSVAENELLLELDTRAERLALDAESARGATLDAQIAALERELALRVGNAALYTEADGAALEQERLRLGGLELEARLARADHERLARLHTLGGASDAEVDRARTEAEKRDVAVDVQRAGGARVQREQGRAEAERALEVEHARGELARLRAERVAAAAAIAKLQHELERRSVRARAAGVIGETSDRVVGSHVRAGERLGAIVSGGVMRVEADFEPAAALGRVRVGQRAELRLDGFPWSRFGSVPLRVEQVASEARDARIRVLLALEGAAPAALPLEHGLPGTVEVAVETQSPLELVLRSAGARIASAERAPRTGTAAAASTTGGAPR